MMESVKDACINASPVVNRHDGSLDDDGCGTSSTDYILPMTITDAKRGQD
jgi:hypothetical protein